MKKVILAEDHPIVRRGLRGLIEGENGFAVVAECGSPSEIELALASQRVDFLVLDLQLDRQSTLPLIHRWSRLHTALCILVLTEDAREESLLQAIRSGAQGYLLRTAQAEQLGEALHFIARQGQFLDPRLVGCLFQEVRRNLPFDPYDLTPRELEILEMLVAGQTAKGISQKLVLSVNTVKSHVQSLYRKFGVSDRTQLVLTALESGRVNRLPGG